MTMEVMVGGRVGLHKNNFHVQMLELGIVESPCTIFIQKLICQTLQTVNMCWNNILQRQMCPKSLGLSSMKIRWKKISYLLFSEV